MSHYNRAFSSRGRGAIQLLPGGFIILLVVLCWFANGFIALAQTTGNTNLIPTNIPSGYPKWWFQRGVILPLNGTNPSPSWPGDYPASDDFSVANQGQLKNIVTAANAELQMRLPVTVLNQSNAIALTQLINGWSTNASSNADNYAAINQGRECKNVSVNWKSATSLKEPPLG